MPDTQNYQNETCNILQEWKDPFPNYSLKLIAWTNTMDFSLSENQLDGGKIKGKQVNTADRRTPPRAINT